MKIKRYDSSLVLFVIPVLIIILIFLLSEFGFISK